MRMVKLGEVIRAAGVKAGTVQDVPVYSVTKHAGFVPSREYFKKQVFSKDLSSYKLVEPGDFAYATIHLDEGSIGVAPEWALISPMYTVFSVASELVESSYLLRYLKSPAALSRYPQLGRGAVHRRKSISFSAISELPVPLPVLEEQRRIAAILDQADAIRAKRRRMLDHLDALTQSVFLGMFGPELSTTTTLGDHAAIQGGLQVSHKRELLPVEVPYLRVANVHPGRLELSEVKILRAAQKEVDRTRLLKGDLLFVEGHANPEEVGRMSVWDESLRECVHQNHIIRARVNRDRLLPEFAEAWFNSKLGSRHFRRAARTTSGLNTISASTVRSAPVIDVAIRKQSRFVDRVTEVSYKRKIVQHALAADVELFASLQYRAFRGEL